MKKLIAMALSLVLALSVLTACGGSKEETKAAATETKAEASEDTMKVALVVTGAVNVINSKVQLADFVTTREVVHNGATVKLVEFVEGAETKWKVATSTYGFHAENQQVAKVTVNGYSFRPYTAVSSATAFANLKGTQA